MGKTKSLQTLISHNYLTNSVIPILVIELLLLLLYFSINFYNSAQSKQALLAEVSLSLQEISKREAATINEQLSEVARYARIIQNDHQRFFAEQEQCSLPNGKPQFAVHPNGAFFKQTDNGGASLYYSSTTQIGSQELHKALCSETLDPLLQSIVDSSPVITQAYLNTRDNMNRLYPYMPDAPQQYGPTLLMEDYNFYFAADLKHNPQRKPVWTSAYLDPAGQGWMVSNVVPIYRGDVLEGVSGLDVTIDRFVQQILNLSLPWESHALMVDNQGLILAMQDGIEKLLEVKELKHHDYSENILTTVLKPDEFSLLKHSGKHNHKQLEELFISKAKLSRLELSSTSYLTSQEIIPETGWRMIILVDEASIFAPIYQVEKQAQNIGYVAIALLILFYIVFFIYLQRKALKLSTKIARPIEQLSELTSCIDLNGDAKPQKTVGVIEIDTLNHNYTTMMQELKHRSQELIDGKIREKMIEKEAELFNTLATTDRLTGLANRYKLDEALKFELDRYQRTNQPFGVVMLDIDHFKNVNDNFGHQAGDSFLVEIATLLKENVRKTDLVGRWGGEEFMLICPNNSLPGLLETAEKLRSMIETHQFKQIGHKTASLGLTICTLTDRLDDLIGRADKALYEAKHKGRNCVVYSTKDEVSFREDHPASPNHSLETKAPGDSQGH